MMPWVNLDDRMPRHPKVLRLSDAAFRLHVAGICYCAEHLTNGEIEADMVRFLVPRYRPPALAELVKRGVWLEVEQAYHIHDFLQWNRSREQVLADRERKRKAGRKGADARWHQP